MIIRIRGAGHRPDETNRLDLRGTGARLVERNEINAAHRQGVQRHRGSRLRHDERGISLPGAGHRLLQLTHAPPVKSNR